CRVYDSSAKMLF
nr:immunoglobulin light chain junction region [Macaca mulatta]